MIHQSFMFLARMFITDYRVFLYSDLCALKILPTISSIYILIKFRKREEIHI